MGIQLGAVWDEQTTSVTLAGNLATLEARGLLVSAQIGDFDPVRLVFAWSLSDDAPFQPRKDGKAKLYQIQQFFEYQEVEEE